jgi:hypothetical protein
MTSRDDRFDELRRTWQPPADLRRALPREVELTASAKAVLTLAIVLALAGLFMAGLLDRKARRQAEQISALQDNGVTTQGSVTRRWRTGGKDDERRLAYEFQNGGRVFTGDVSAPRNKWDTLPPGSAIEIRFIPSDPRINHPAEWRMQALPRWLPLLIIAMFSLMAVVFISLIGRQRALLSEGDPAPAIVTRLSSAKNGKVIHYEFAAPDGSIVKGRHGSSRTVPQPGETICILYDRDRPRRNAPYPMDFVRIPGLVQAGVYRSRPL